MEGLSQFKVPKSTGSIDSTQSRGVLAAVGGEEQSQVACLLSGVVGHLGTSLLEAAGCLAG